MTALKFKQYFIQEYQLDRISVIALLDEGGFYHVHDDEQIPEDEIVALIVKGATSELELLEVMNPIERQVTQDAGLFEGSSK